MYNYVLDFDVNTTLDDLLSAAYRCKMYFNNLVRLTQYKIYSVNNYNELM